MTGDLFPKIFIIFIKSLFNMKKFYSILFVLLCAGAWAQQEQSKTLLLEGYYSGSNIVVKNPFLSGGKGFCAYEVKVNGEVSTAETNSEMFQIPLDKHQLKQGELVKVEIRHASPCGIKTQPAIMNPGALLSRENFTARTENKLVIETTFNWTNILIMNRRDEKGNYGIKKIVLNGKPMEINLNTAVINIEAMRIGFIEGKQAGFKEGDKMKLEFTYSKGCDPFFLNAEALVPFSDAK
jgi:hypothetical protein